ncbi:hypothetical protein [Mycobacterium sp. 1081908.1]|uniref:hypothetical protein n=1 Tax=Mycobacterium sp. 1081908.1 TaxID=1834066 RepID=UPI00080064EB|nr:hypothetical protein [Mycobacterium sp. 1081908.1]OBK48905.1 hypothetical protein A5655_03285 [Mycobacterium sp. 1081908.1]
MTNGPARNRVSPLGEIIAAPGRGAWMGNRGRLHEGRGTRVAVRNHQHKTWITCVLSFRSRRVAQWEPNRYTPLFFLDEAVSLAAGHRPCAECRRGAYNEYRDLWAETHSGATPYAKDIDAQLHLERINRAGHRAAWDDLPDGVFVVTERGPAVVVGDHLRVWNRLDYSYGGELARPAAGAAVVVTPPSNVAILRASYPVQLGPRKCN